MLCPNCNNNVIDNVDFCPSCGKNIKGAYNEVQKPNFNNNNSGKKRLLIIVLIIAVLLLFLGTILLIKLNANTNANNNQIVEKNENSFLMPIEDIFVITGRGTVVKGIVERGTVTLNDEIQIVGLDKNIISTTVIGVSKFKSTEKTAKKGDAVDLLLKGVSRSDVSIGQVVAKPNSIKASKKFKAELYMFTKAEGGRSTPIFNNYRGQFHFRVVDISGSMYLPKSVDGIYPGDNVKIDVELTTAVAMETGTEFTVVENEKIIGRGKVIKLN